MNMSITGPNWSFVKYTIFIDSKNPMIIKLYHYIMYY